MDEGIAQLVGEAVEAVSAPYGTVVVTGTLSSVTEWGACVRDAEGTVWDVQPDTVVPIETEPEPAPVIPEPRRPYVRRFWGRKGLWELVRPDRRGPHPLYASKREAIAAADSA